MSICTVYVSFPIPFLTPFQQFGGDPVKVMLRNARCIQDFLIDDILGPDQVQYAPGARRRGSAPNAAVHETSGCGFPCTVVPLNVRSFKETLDEMHTIVLERMNAFPIRANGE